MVLKDLLYQIEGSPDFMDPQKRIMNMMKMQSIGHLMENFAIFANKTHRYLLKEERATYNLLKNIPTVEVRLL